MHLRNIAGVLLGWMVCFGSAAMAADKEYFEAIGTYKGELSQEPPKLVNGDFYAVQAESQVNRALLESKNKNNVNIVVDGNSADSARNRGGNIDIASPHINGRVNGNVNIIVQRGAIKGDINAVRQR